MPAMSESSGPRVMVLAFLRDYWVTFFWVSLLIFALRRAVLNNYDPDPELC